MVYNFSAGPATIYKEVLIEIQQELLDYKGIGYSLIESSHRNTLYDEIHNNAINTLKTLLGLGNDYSVLLLGGGATLQFSMLAYNFLSAEKTAQYINTGSWAQAAIKNAQKVMSTNSANIDIIWDGSKTGFSTLPDASEMQINPKCEYLHLTSNETIGGIQWKSFPETASPLVADMSSDILSRTIDASKFALLYAGAQKNLGPSGVTVIVINNTFLYKANDNLPDSLSYKLNVEKNSLLNTPPVFSIWVLERVLNHITQLGGISEIEKTNARKAKMLYQAIEDSDGFYTSPVDARYRSDMNVVFKLANTELEAKFLQETQQANLFGLKGHRSVGGCRASIYNAMSIEGVEALVKCMKQFKQAN